MLGTIRGFKARCARCVFVLTVLCPASSAWAQTVFGVGSQADLQTAISLLQDGDVIAFTGDITLSRELPAIQRQVTIDGAGRTLQGDGVHRGFFLYSGSGRKAVRIERLTFRNFRAAGGAGGNSRWWGGGGGGAGLGGAIFVHENIDLVLSSVGFDGNSAAGGAGGGHTHLSGGGGGFGTGGGGGMGGAGGHIVDGTAHGGGGGLGFEANGEGDSTPPGVSAIVAGADGGAFASGGGLVPTGRDGGFGGGGGAEGGAGGFGGGGGAGVDTEGGPGGFGGGGGAGNGQGGFGGGNTASQRSGGGGGGLGAGGAVFVQAGGTLTLEGPTLAVAGGNVAAGSGGAGSSSASNGAPGSAFGSGLFLAGNGTLNFSVANFDVLEVWDVIADQSGSGGTGANAGEWGLTISGTGSSGMVMLMGDNTYSGPTEVQNGVLGLGGSIRSPTVVQGGARLQGSGTIDGTVTVRGFLSPRVYGTMRLGSLTLYGVYEVFISSAAHDSVAVTGGVSLFAPILSLDVTTAPPVGTVLTIIDNDGTDAVFGTFTGLPEGSVVTVGPRRFRISYVGGDGNDVTLTVIGVPDPPVIGAATAGNGEATIAFAAPAFDGGVPITAYTVTCDPGSISVSGAPPSATVPGLSNGTTYTCSVTATNSLGTSAPSGTVSVTPATVPGAPTIGLATAGDGQATIAFTPPVDTGGSTITGYTVTCNPGAIAANGAGSPIAVAGLANGTTYVCSVTATNAEGTGLASGTVSVTPATVPGAPTIGTATPGIAQATLAFTPPAFDGGSAITGYAATCNPGGITASGASSPIIVSGLANGTTYSCTIAATNAMGTGPASAPVTVTPTFTTFSGPSATGSGIITASFTSGDPACAFDTPAFIDAPPGAPPVPPTAPPNATFPHGLFDFRLVGCTPGDTVTVTVTYPSALPAGTVYWKYGPTPSNPAPHWYVLSATISGATATFSITDGGVGDDDLTANGTIVDQGGPGVPGPGGGPVQVPTLSAWAILVMTLLLAFVGMGAMRAGARRG